MKAILFLTVMLPVSVSAATLTTNFTARITSVGSVGSSLGLSVGDPVAGQLFYDIDPSNVEFIETTGSSSAGVWANGFVNPNYPAGVWDGSLQVSSGGQTWSINNGTDMLGAISGGGDNAAIVVDEGGAGIGFGQTGDYVAMDYGTIEVLKFPGLAGTAADEFGYMDVNVGVYSLMSDFITDPTVAPSSIPNGASGSGVVSLRHEELLNPDQEIFRYEILAFQAIPEPTTGFHFVALL